MTDHTPTSDDSGPAELADGVVVLDADAQRVAGLEEQLPALGQVVRHVRGHWMRTVADLYRETAAALQFPLYFGGNKDAFDECLADAADPDAPATVVVVYQADEVLADEPAKWAWWLDAMTASPLTLMLHTAGSVPALVDRIRAGGFEPAVEPV